jgi:hypothetical protein
MTGGHRRRSLAVGAALSLALAGAACDGRSASDSAITDDVSSRLESDPELGPLDLEVETRDGVVTLSGRVVQPAQRGEAEQIARRTDGVEGVINLIETGVGSTRPGQPDVGAGPGAGAAGDKVE